MIRLLTLLASLIGLRRDRNNAPVAWDPPEVPIPLGEWPPDTSPLRPADPGVCAHSGCVLAVTPPMIACSEEHYHWWAQSMCTRRDVA